MGQQACPVARWNEVGVLWVAADVAGYEGAARDHREVPGACVLEGRFRQRQQSRDRIARAGLGRADAQPKRAAGQRRAQRHELAAFEVAKRFEVISAQKIDNRWFLKQMRVEELEPGTSKVQARTYLEIKK